MHVSRYPPSACTPDFHYSLCTTDTMSMKKRKSDCFCHLRALFKSLSRTCSFCFCFCSVLFCCLFSSCFYLEFLVYSSLLSLFFLLS